MPVSPENVELLEKAVESCIMLQPYVVGVDVKIDREKLKQRLSGFGYTALSEELLNVTVRVKVGSSEVLAELSWDKDLRYPLMKLKEVREV
jgi:hypothetical protein